MITLSKSEWITVSNKLKSDWAHKPSVLMIREVMKRELGFTTREHCFWNPGMSNYTELMYLDFYDEPSETMFRLRYL